MSSAICFNLDQSKILLFGNGLNLTLFCLAKHTLEYTSLRFYNLENKLELSH